MSYAEKAKLRILTHVPHYIFLSMTKYGTLRIHFPLTCIRIATKIKLWQVEILIQICTQLVTDNKIKILSIVKLE